MKLRLLHPITWLALAVLALVLWKGPQWSAPSVPEASSASPAPTDAATVERGQYLARIGNCAFCHTARGGAPFAGGRAIDTPFGAVVTSNITSDPHEGIGQWSPAEFWRAMHHGVSRDGRLLYPAFPYTSYTHLTRQDTDALWAYLQTVPASANAPADHALPWPYSTQAALWGWRMLNFKAVDGPGTDASVPPKVDAVAWSRGAYLTQGLGHCFECHSSRNGMGAVVDKGQGSVLPGSRWYAPSLRDRMEGSVADWSEAEVVEFLTRGTTAKAVASGPMAEVVLHGTQYLSPADARAMASYLRTLPAITSPPVAALQPQDITNLLKEGGKLYEQHCADCHGSKGEGVVGVYPALAGNRAVNMANTHNLGHAVLRGGFAPATSGNPRPYGMPPFIMALSDSDIAAVLSYVRHEWGNTGGLVTEFDITQIRR